MKTLDVHALHEGIQHTIEKLDKQKQQLEKLEKSVEHLAGMKDALKGKGGDAIRTFYEECHKPFLLFFGMFIDEYKKMLKQTQHAISSVESDSHGMIAEAFLSHDARHGIKHAREVTEQLTDAVNRQTSAIGHIVSLPTVNDSFFRLEIEQAERLISDTLNKLFQFDGQQTQALETAKSDFQTMKKYIDQLETMYTGPKIEITGYKSGSILKSQEEEKINQTFGAINPQMKQADDSPMEMMLKKLEKHKQSNVDSVMMDDKQQKIEREIYGDDSNLTVLQKEAAMISPKVAGDIRVINGKLYNVKGWKVVQRVDVADETVRNQADINYIGGVYSIYENGQIVRRYLKNGKPSIEIVEKIPEGRSAGGVKNIDEEAPGLGKVTDTIGEFFVVNDGIRATTGEDPKTNKKVSVDERILSTLFIIPIAKIGKYVFVWSKGEKALTRIPSVEKKNSYQPIWKISDLTATDNFKKGSKSNALNHIFDGEIVKDKAVGFHYEGLSKSHGKVIGNVDPPNKYGVYRANIEVNGVTKKAKSTFFPREWTPQQVINEINLAFDNKVLYKNNRYRGTASNGMTIEIIVKNGKVVSAYPVY
ncbi:T7SS effector LXG polymorphic toxin [Bacillus halotolerans]